MREKYGDSVKFGRDPFTEWLHDESLNGGYESTGDTQFGEHVCLMGRFTLHEDSQGFVWHVRHENREAARLAIDTFQTEFYADDEEDDDEPQPNPYAGPGGLLDEVRQAERLLGDE